MLQARARAPWGGQDKLRANWRQGVEGRGPGPSRLRGAPLHSGEWTKDPLHQDRPTGAWTHSGADTLALDRTGATCLEVLPRNSLTNHPQGLWGGRNGPGPQTEMEGVSPTLVPGLETQTCMLFSPSRSLPRNRTNSPIPH